MQNVDVGLAPGGGGFGILDLSKCRTSEFYCILEPFLCGAALLDIFKDEELDEVVDPQRRASVILTSLNPGSILELCDGALEIRG